MILKSSTLSHDKQKFSSNLLSNPNEGFLNLEAQKTCILTKTFEKMPKIVRNKIKIVMFKSCKTFHYIQKLYSNQFSNHTVCSLALVVEKNEKNLKKRQILKLEKSKLYQTIAKNCDNKKLKTYSMANKNLSVTYYQTS